MNVLRPACRSCGYSDLAPVLSLGRTPLANALLRADQLDQPEPAYPLDLAFCPRCALVQILATLPPEQLFREYLYFSSFSDALLDHARAIVERMIAARKLDEASRVIEIASNDGYLLQYYQARGVPVLGIEPALNVAQVAREQRGIPTLAEFFDARLARQLSQGGHLADVIHANNVLAHVADLNGFVAGIAQLLAGDGIAVIEAPYLHDMIAQVEFDTIYHEHLCYFSLTALERLFCRHALRIVDVERLPIHGGSLRIFVAHQHAAESPAVQRLLQDEAGWGVARVESYQHFGAQVARLREELVALLKDLKAQGKRIAAYGASAKGSTLLNYCGIGRETLDFVVDRSPAKQGRYTPGARLSIYPVEHLLEAMPDYTLLLTWNFAGEILQQQAAYRARGGQFIVPIPRPEVV